jgi:G3E family GTPase
MLQRIPVNVLTGFLGSGKTSLLNRLLRDPAFANCAVLINEFGSVGIDHHLVDQVVGDIVLLKSGCICCTIRGDLADSLRELYGRRERAEVPPFARVVVETTGLADPAPVVATVMNDRILQHHFRPANVITTVDSLNGEGNLRDHPECLRQAALADRLVLTKLDLAPEAQVERLMESLQPINPVAMLVRNDAALDAQMLLGEDAFDASTKGKEVARWMQAVKNRHFFALRQPPQEQNTHSTTSAFSVELDSAIDWTVFGVWLTLLLHTYGAQVLRVKGLINVAGSDTPVVIHGVQQMVYPPTHLDRWPDGDRQSRLVFIVRGLDPAAVEASLKAFLNAFKPAALVA